MLTRTAFRSRKHSRGQVAESIKCSFRTEQKHAAPLYKRAAKKQWPYCRNTFSVIAHVFLAVTYV